MTGIAKGTDVAASTADVALAAKEGGTGVADVARTGRADAVSEGLVHRASDRRAEGRKPRATKRPSKQRKDAESEKRSSKEEPSGPAAAAQEGKSAWQARRHLAALAADGAADAAFE